MAAAKPTGPYHLVNGENVYLGEAVKLQPGVVLDASNGPITIGSRANIGANTVIQGPAYIGEYTQLMPLSYIRPGTSIGPNCKIGGEVSNSIIEANVNKIHYGFLGDSYVGEWANLGAGTTTSNLKNTYDEVTMTIAGKTYKTGRKFVGAIIGDHSKTGIGTRLTSGSYIGYCCSLAGSQIPPRWVPSFSFVTDKGTEPFRMDKALQIMQAVYGRRNRQWTADDAAQVEVASRMAKQAETPT
jgi:UDP-N-acetylglucosamine diphosphorylase/glucosamine-1-phosphate N-acetyltransferase